MYRFHLYLSWIIDVFTKEKTIEGLLRRLTLPYGYGFPLGSFCDYEIRGVFSLPASDKHLSEYRNNYSIF